MQTFLLFDLYEKTHYALIIFISEGYKMDRLYIIRLDREYLCCLRENTGGKGREIAASLRPAKAACGNVLSKNRTK